MDGVQSPEVEFFENQLHVVCDSTASASTEQRPRDFCWIWHPAVINGAWSRRLTGFRTVVRTTHQSVSRCFLQLCLIKSCVHALPMDAAKTIVNSFVISRVDYCNSLLTGAPRYQLDRLYSRCWTRRRGCSSASRSTRAPDTCCGTAFIGFQSSSASSSSCVCWHLKRCTELHRRISPMMMMMICVNQWHQLVADRDRDLPLAATSSSVQLSRTLVLSRLRR